MSELAPGAQAVGVGPETSGINRGAVAASLLCTALLVLLLALPFVRITGNGAPTERHTGFELLFLEQQPELPWPDALRARGEYEVRNLANSVQRGAWVAFATLLVAAVTSTSVLLSPGPGTLRLSLFAGLLLVMAYAALLAASILDEPLEAEAHPQPGLILSIPVSIAVLLAVFTAHWRQRAAEDPSRDSSALGATALALGVLSVITGFLSAGLSWDHPGSPLVLFLFWAVLAAAAVLGGIIAFARGAWVGLLAVLIAGWPMAFIAGLWLCDSAYDARDYDFYGLVPGDGAESPAASRPGHACRLGFGPRALDQLLLPSPFPNPCAS